MALPLARRLPRRGPRPPARRLDRRRAEEERLSGAAVEESGKKSKGKTTRGKKKPANDDQLDMFSQVVLRDRGRTREGRS